MKVTPERRRRWIDHASKRRMQCAPKSKEALRWKLILYILCYGGDWNGMCRALRD